MPPAAFCAPLFTFCFCPAIDVLNYPVDTSLVVRDKISSVTSYSVNDLETRLKTDYDAKLSAVIKENRDLLDNAIVRISKLEKENNFLKSNNSPMYPGLIKPSKLLPITCY